MKKYQVRFARCNDRAEFSVPDGAVLLNVEHLQSGYYRVAYADLVLEEHEEKMRDGD